MEIVNFLAQLWGFSLVIVCLALLIKPRNTEALFSLVENNTVLFLAGLINIVFGVAMVLSYNVWDHSWRVLVTFINWLVIVRGSLILFFPEFVQKMVGRIKMRPDWFSMIMVGGVILGCFFLYAGFTL